MSQDVVPRIVAIHGAPRSGTSWLGQLFNSNEHVAYRYQPLFSHSFRGRIDTSSGRPELARFFADLLATDDPFVLQRGAAALAGYELIFAKSGISHLVYKEVRFHDLLPHLIEQLPELQAVGIVRDPRAVIRSWTAAPREFREEWDLEHEWRDAPAKNAGRQENWYGFERWKALAELFLRLRDRFPGRFTLIRYEALVERPERVLQMLFDRCGLTVTRQVGEFLRRSQNEQDSSPYGVFRKVRGARRLDALIPSIALSIEQELQGSALEQFLDPSLAAGP